MTEIDALRNAETGAPNNNTQNANSSQTSLQKVDQTTIQNKDPEPSTSKSKSPTTSDHESNAQVSLSSVNVGVVQQLDSLLKKSTGELDELKSLLKEYLETEKANKTPRVDKKVQIQSPKSKKKMPSRSSSNSDMSLHNVKSKKKIPRDSEPCQKINVEKKSKIIKIKQVSKSTKTTKCGLSDISESNEMERNSSSSDMIPVRKQNRPSPSKKNYKPAVTSDKQTELTLNIISKSGTTLSSSDEDKRQHIRDFIEKTPRDPNDLMNPPNTVRLALPENKDSEREPKKDSNDKKKKGLSVQILPPLDIRRSLTTQKLPDIEIESIEDFELTNKVSSENVKYIQIKHHSDKELPKQQPLDVVQVKPVSEVESNLSTIKETLESVESPTKDKTIKDIYIAPQQMVSSTITISSSETSSESDHISPRELPEKKSTVREELNLDIESLPSVRKLKEIQSYLEQKCCLIRNRLQEESKLKTGETLSLRYKLSEPPRWQNSKAETANKSTSIEDEPIPKPKPTTLSPLKTYATVKTPLSPLTQKHDNFQQVRYNPSLIANQKSVDKSLQTSFTENLDIPIAREDHTAASSSQHSAQPLSKNIQLKTPPPKIPETNKPNENTTSVSPKQDACICCIPQPTDALNVPNEKNIRPENQVTDKPVTDINININKFSNTSTQINEIDLQLESEPRKCVTFEIVTNQFSVIPKENKETQITQTEPDEKMTKKPVKKDGNTQTTKLNNETVVKEKQAPIPPISIVRYIQSSSTQTVKDKETCTVCNLPETKGKEIVQIKPVPVPVPVPTRTNTKDCCTQYSPIEQQEQLDATQYKQIPSFRKSDEREMNRNENENENEEQANSKHVHYPEERRHYYKSKIKSKRAAPQRYKVCSTPVSASSSSISAADSVSFSDGEVKLSCECSTSIGEIHLCRFANDIRKKVRILKQNPEKVLKESFGGRNFKMTREHKYNENWFAYYVTKTGSSSENGTGSNLSSIKSNIETE